MKRKNPYHIRGLFPRTSLFLAVIWLVMQPWGCTSFQEKLEYTNTKKPVLPATIVITQTQTRSYTPGILPSQTAPINTFSTSTATASLTHTPTLTWTPIPTLLPAQVQEIKEILQSNNNGCELPCIWGIIPGQTSWRETYEKFGPLGEIFTIQLGRDLAKVSVNGPDFLVDHGVVIAISLASKALSKDFDYSLAGLLNTLGQPEGVWLELWPDSMTIPQYHLILSYPAFGAEVFYHGIATVKSDTFTFCPQDIFSFEDYYGFQRGSPDILVWALQNIIPFQSMQYSKLRTMVTRDARQFTQLGELSGEWDEEKFFDAYRDPETRTCIEIPVK